MGKRLIATGTTDSNGQVKITYTGKGAGKLQLTAESGTLQSETYVLTDAIFYDAAVTGKTSTEWGYNSTDIQISTEGDGTTISNVGTTGRTYWANYPGSSKTTGDEWNSPLVVEVDMLSASDTGTNVALQLVKGSSAISRNMSQLGVVNGGHIKIVCDGSTAKYYVNDSETPNHSQNWTETDFSIRFYVVNGYDFKYKNFMIYPI
jgi:hypothetical protein